jgi:hypothetical protein
MTYVPFRGLVCGYTRGVPGCLPARIELAPVGPSRDVQGAGTHGELESIKSRDRILTEVWRFSTFRFLLGEPDVNCAARGNENYPSRHSSILFLKLQYYLQKYIPCYDTFANLIGRSSPHLELIPRTFPSIQIRSPSVPASPTCAMPPTHATDALTRASVSACKLPVCEHNRT